MRFVPACLWAALIFFLSSQHSLPHWVGGIFGVDKVVHAGAYAVLCATCLHAGKWPRHLAGMGWAALATSLYGITDEWHQGYVPGRSQDVYDWVADTFGALCCVAIWYAFGAKLRAGMQWLQKR